MTETETTDWYKVVARGGDREQTFTVRALDQQAANDYVRRTTHWATTTEACDE